jgi:glutamate 5-kinase
LVLLTNVDGLYSADPRTDPAAELVATVPHIDHAVTDMAGASKSDLGTGGMRSKLKAARVATDAGVAVVMANGSLDGILDRVFAAEPVGTLFLPHRDDIPAWKRWVGYTARPVGTLTIDAGAVRAVVELGKSLLPVGVVAVGGEFRKGDVVSVCDAAGREVARGLSNYAAADAQRLRGKAGAPYAELIHRDNLVVTAPG